MSDNRDTCDTGGQVADDFTPRGLTDRLRASSVKLARWLTEIDLPHPGPNLFDEAVTAIEHMRRLLEVAIDCHDAGGAVLPTWYVEAAAAIDGCCGTEDTKRAAARAAGGGDE